MPRTDFGWGHNALFGSHLALADEQHEPFVDIGTRLNLLALQCDVRTAQVQQEVHIGLVPRARGRVIIPTRERKHACMRCTHGLAWVRDFA